MTLTTTEWLSAGVSGASLLVTLLQLRYVNAGLAEARKEVSRYKLYEARDELVRIVASGSMDESDAAWNAAYATVNNLLNIHERLDIFAVIKRYAKFNQAIAASPRLKREIELRDREMRRASREVPAFKAALSEIENGFLHATRRQTGFLQSLALLIAVGVIGALPNTTSPGALSTWAQRCTT